jgi:hypothetical protein
MVGGTRLGLLGGNESALIDRAGKAGQRQVSFLVVSRWNERDGERDAWKSLRAGPGELDLHCHRADNLSLCHAEAPLHSV